MITNMYRGASSMSCGSLVLILVLTACLTENKDVYFDTPGHCNITYTVDTSGYVTVSGGGAGSDMNSSFYGSVLTFSAASPEDRLCVKIDQLKFYNENLQLDFYDSLDATTFKQGDVYHLPVEICSLGQAISLQLKPRSHLARFSDAEINIKVWNMHRGTPFRKSHHKGRPISLWAIISITSAIVISAGGLGVATLLLRKSKGQNRIPLMAANQCGCFLAVRECNPALCLLTEPDDSESDDEDFWVCPKPGCGSYNPVLRSRCKLCGTPKPEALIRLDRHSTDANIGEIEESHGVVAIEKGGNGHVKEGFVLCADDKLRNDGEFESGCSRDIENDGCLHRGSNDESIKYTAVNVPGKGRGDESDVTDDGVDLSNLGDIARDDGVGDSDAKDDCDDVSKHGYIANDGGGVRCCVGDTAHKSVVYTGNVIDTGNDCVVNKYSASNADMEGVDRGNVGNISNNDLVDGGNVGDIDTNDGDIAKVGDVPGGDIKDGGYDSVGDVHGVDGVDRGNVDATDKVGLVNDDADILNKDIDDVDVLGPSEDESGATDKNIGIVKCSGADTKFVDGDKSCRTGYGSDSTTIVGDDNVVNECNGDRFKGADVVDGGGESGVIGASDKSGLVPGDCCVPLEGNDDAGNVADPAEVNCDVEDGATAYDKDTADTDNSGHVDILIKPAGNGDSDGGHRRPCYHGDGGSQDAPGGGRKGDGGAGIGRNSVNTGDCGTTQ